MHAVRLCLIVCLAPLLAQSEPFWGDASNQIELSIERQGSAFILTIKNASAQPQHLNLGMEGTAGPIYNIKLSAIAPGLRYVVFDKRALASQVPSFPVLIQILLEPGQSKKITYPLDPLLCVVEAKDAPLEAILKKGFSLRAALDLPTGVVQTELPPLPAKP